ncbi:MAG TPA: oxidoreductase [Pseudonocardiaceae bacterium]|nr:oxidoreductase [Pseudonocardiaceae bacterium]
MARTDVLADPAYTVPGPGGVAWLRASVARFCDGPTHERRRALAVAELAAVDVAELRKRAAAHTDPVAVLADALGLPPEVADDVVDDVAVIARSYHPHTEITPAADQAVDRLVAVCGGMRDEATANRIGLLVQACDATRALVATMLAGSDDPPVVTTRRVAPDGGVVEIPLTDAPFGVGPHACPGRDHAYAIAAGLVARSTARSMVPSDGGQSGPR